jgi:hypothetical protein
LRGPGVLALEPPAGPCWPGFLTTCLLAGASPRRGSKEARAPAHADEGSRQPFAVEPLMRRNLACRGPARGLLAPNADACPARD